MSFLADTLPFVLFLTHRRGVALLAVDPAAVEGDGTAWPSPQRLEKTIALTVPWQRCVVMKILSGPKPASNPDGLASAAGPGWLALISQATTSENLTVLYDVALRQFPRLDRTVVGIGPGSFTGLRIGCAFANGLARGRARELWSIPCLDPEPVEEWLQNGPHAGTSWWSQELESLKSARDPSQAPVTWVDLVAAIGALGGQECVRQDEGLYPAYGKEPGPVLKLRDRLLKKE